MRSRIKLWFRSLGDAGASAVEYGLLVGGIAVLILAVVFTLGESVRDNLFRTSCNDLAAAAGQPSC